MTLIVIITHGETKLVITQVVMGGGRQRLMPINETDPEYPEKNGTRKDGRNIIDEWLNDKATKGKKATYVWKKDDFDQIDPSKLDHVIGKSLAHDWMLNRSIMILTQSRNLVIS